MPRRLAASSAARRRLAVVAAGCGGGEQPVRIGVLVDCVGALRAATSDGAARGAELPLIRRGARPAGRAPTEGLSRDRGRGTAGRDRAGLHRDGRHTRLVEEARRLVERRASTSSSGRRGGRDVLRQVARRYPGCHLRSRWAGAGDDARRPRAQRLPLHARRGAERGGPRHVRVPHLGWRRAAVVAADATGWEAAAALHGRVLRAGRTGGRSRRLLAAPTRRRPPRARQPGGRRRGRRSRPSSATRASSWRSLAVGSPARPGGGHRRPHVPGSEKPALGRRPRGVVGVASCRPPPTPRAARPARSRPPSPASPPRSCCDPSCRLRRLREALAPALEAPTATHRGQARLRRGARALRLDLARGPVRLDGNRQAVAPATSAGSPARGGPAVVPVSGRSRRRPDLRRAALRRRRPRPGPPACVRGTPPPWAR